MTRLAPRSTLFPYTTLFRSSSWAASRSSAATIRQRTSGVTWSAGSSAAMGSAASAELRDAAHDDSVHTEQSANLDRKSTRLNSSHSQISYAVFCLKKKNRNY